MPVTITLMYIFDIHCQTQQFWKVYHLLDFTNDEKRILMSRFKLVSLF